MRKDIHVHMKPILYETGKATLWLCVCLETFKHMLL